MNEHDPATTSAPPAATRRWRPLEERERRVLGVLVEKAKTTPAGYPMTVSALVTGCNQKSNREPVMDLEPFDVERALGRLQDCGAVSEVDWMGRTSKFRHHAYEWLGVDRVQLAVLAELLLRGAQTLGDLRARAARMEPIADLAALKPIVDALVAKELMVELTPPGRGQVVTHNLYLAPEMDALRARHAGGGAADVEPIGRAAAAHASPAAAGELDALRAEVAELRERVAALEARLGDSSG